MKAKPTTTAVTITERRQIRERESVCVWGRERDTRGRIILVWPFTQPPFIKSALCIQTNKRRQSKRVRESSRDSRRQATAAAARQATTAPTTITATTRSPESQHVRRGGHPQNGVYIAWHILRILFALILALHWVSLAVSPSLSVCRCFCYGHGL